MAHILIVEDDPDVYEVVKKLLENRGHTWDHACDGRRAHEIVTGADFDYDLILCDLHLPRMTGRAFLEQVHPFIQWRTPVIIMSGVPYMIEALGEIRRGAFTILEKPFDSGPFDETVARALDQRHTYRRLQELKGRVDELTKKCTVLVKQNEQLFDQVRLDVLTQLPNRLRLFEDLHVLDANRRRYESRFALAILDVDEFGRYNKEYGLTVGDAALRLVASIIREACRQGDTVYRFGQQEGESAYRFGGDEFVLILATQDLPHATAAVERIRQQLSATQLGREEPGLPDEYVTFSAGVVANDPEDQRTIEEMLLEANEHLKEAKAAGGNCIRPEPPAV